jgi:hypothetical protein
MIGVVAKEEEQPLIREFFELFKTPWEFHRSGRRYEVVICSDGECADSSAKLVVVYGSGEKACDQANKIQIRSQRRNAMLTYQQSRIPIYGNCATFNASRDDALMIEENSHELAAVKVSFDKQMFVRVGFDLFHEIRHLLTCGQPPAHAQIPTLELHVAFLRDLIVSNSILLVEIPPVPEGHSFITCLTHDVDHVGIRNHKFDHTMFGFLYRAVIGSIIRFCRGEMSATQVGNNWAAALKLPFIHLGLAKDFWYQFEHYVEIEEGLVSTFFVVPYKNNPGRALNGHVQTKRATSYDVTDITEDIRKLGSAGREIGLHGIDAWFDSSSGRTELNRIAATTRTADVGVRMHWLYFNEKSPSVLEDAGFSYDSTVGYNECVGYRAGTGQAFKPLGVSTLLELPMHVMDTALFYPSRMNSSSAEAETLVNELVENAARFGGVLTINWHDRSIAPERLWDVFYVKLLKELKGKGAWFPTAAQAVSWFRKRRAAVIEDIVWDDGKVRIKATANYGKDSLPGLRLRIYNLPAQPAKSGAGFVDVTFSGDMDKTLAL